MTRITDERLEEIKEGWAHQSSLVHDCSLAGWQYQSTCEDTAAALRELQSWRRGLHPDTGDPIGRLVVMQPWNEDTE